jgi:hypothetical protein
MHAKTLGPRRGVIVAKPSFVPQGAALLVKSIPVGGNQLVVAAEGWRDLGGIEGICEALEYVRCAIE